MLRKKHTAVLLLIVVTFLLLSGCKTSIPSIKKTKEDLVGKSYRNKYGMEKITYVEEIKEFKVIDKEVNKKERRYHITANITLDKEYLTIKDKVKIDYIYNPNKGWEINDINTYAPTTQITFNKLLQVDDIKKSLVGKNIRYRSESTNINWNIENVDEIERLTIKDRNTYDQKLKDDINIEMVSKNGVEQLTAEAVVEFIYNFHDNKWYIDQIKIQKADKKLYSGINIDLLKKLLVNETIPNYIESSSYGYSSNYNWNIHEENEIKKINILEQNTNLDNYTDKLKVEIELQKDNIVAKGNIDIDLIYEETYGWRIKELNTIKPFAFNLTNDITYNINTFEKHLVGQKFLYQGSFLGDFWLIEEGEIQKISIKRKIPFEYGKTVVLVTNLELKGANDTIVGDAYIVYSLNDGKWKFKNIKKVNDFEIKSNID